MLAIHHYLMLRLRMSGSVPLLPLCFHDMDRDIPVTFSTVSLFCVEVSASPLSLLSFFLYFWGNGSTGNLPSYHCFCQDSKISSRGNFV